MGHLTGLVRHVFTPAAAASPTVDGTHDASYGSALAVQTVETGFGDNCSELDAGYALIDSGKLYLMLTGNIEANFNKLNIFIDSKAGGQSTFVSAGNDDSNVAGVAGGLAAANQAAAAAVTTGLELGIALSDLDYLGGPIRIMVGQNAGGHDYWSNQFLADLPAPQDNLGGDELGDFTGEGAIDDRACRNRAGELGVLQQATEVARASAALLTISTRLKNSITSMCRIRMQPCEAGVPIESHNWRAGSPPGNLPESRGSNRCYRT